MSENAYHDNYYGWLLEQERALDTYDAKRLDWMHLRDEVIASRQDLLDKVQRFLSLIAEHLIKLRCAHENTKNNNAQHWRHEIAVFQQELVNLLERNRSLETALPSLVDGAVQLAIKKQLLANAKEKHAFMKEDCIRKQRFSLEELCEKPLKRQKGERKKNAKKN